MATEQNDQIIVQRGDISGFGGDDVFILSAASISDGEVIQISDNEGVNTIQLIEGLTIASAEVASFATSTGGTSNALKLILSNSAQVTILSAQNFNFEIGGNPLTGTAGDSVDFTTFITDTLGGTVPAVGDGILSIDAIDFTVPGTGGGSTGGGSTGGGSTGGGSTQTESLSLTTTADNLIGTDGADMFEARVVQNINGEQTNQLATGDRIDGGTGADSLMAKVIEASPLNAGPQMAITPETVDVETVSITALTSVLGGDNPVEINAKYMLGLDSIGSVQSDESVIISNLTTLTDTGVYAERRNTETVTIRMDHSNNGDAVSPESDLSVYFDQDYLLSGQSSQSDGFWFILDQDAELVSDPNRLNNINVDGIRFNITMDGVTSDVTIADLTSWSDGLMVTHQGFVDALQDEVNSLIDDGVLPEGTTLTLDETITDQTFLDDGSQSAPIPAIKLSVTGSTTIEPTGFSQVSDALGAYNVYGRFNNLDSSVDLPIISTVELEKVGRGSDGGDLTIGGMSTDNTNTWDSGSGSKGVEQFNISVSGDASQPSSLASLQSTNNTLTTVKIISMSGSEASLTLGNSATATSVIDINSIADNDDDVTTGLNGALKDVRELDASGFVNDLKVHAYVSDESVAKYMNLSDTAADPAADNARFAYTSGSGNDMLNLNISKTNLAESGSTNREDFSMTITTNSGDDKVETQIGDGTGVATDHWYINSELNDNLTINTGSGNDTVRTFGAGSWNVDLGSGNDVIYSDNSGNQNNTAQDTTLDVEDPTDLNYNSGRAVWVLNTSDQITSGAMARDIDNLQSDANGHYALYLSDLTVNLRGITQTIRINDFNTTDLELNNLIKSAVENNTFMKNLIAVEDGPANTLVIRSLTDGVFDSTDFSVSVASTTIDAMSASAISDFNAANGTALTTAAEVQTQVDNDVASFNLAADYETAMANDGTVDLTGMASSAVTASVITDGSGNDTIVLSTSGLDTETVNLTTDGQADVIYNVTNATINGLDAEDIVILSDGTMQTGFTSGTSQTFTSSGVATATYAVTAGAASVDEGNSVDFTLATTNVAEGTTLVYTLSGDIDANDIDGGNLTGTVTVDASGAATATIALLADATTEGAENMTLTIEGADASVTVNDTSTATTTTATVNITAAGSDDASTADVAYSIAAGTYTYTINGFGSGDTLAFFTGAAISVVPDTDDTDGIQSIEAADAATGATTTITLTGLTAGDDAGLFNLGSIDTVFGAGTIV